MRKLFSILAVAITAISLHATVVTKDITWTLTDDGNSFDLTAWGNMPTKWDWTEGCAEYDQLVFEFDAPTGDIAVKAQFTEGENAPDIASSAVLHVGDNSLAVNVAADVLHSVDVKNYSGSAQTITLTRMYLRKAVGPKKPETLWSGEMTFDSWKDWGDRLVIAPEKFADIHIGDIIEFEYTVSGSNQQLNLISPHNSYKMAFVGVLDGENYNINSEVNPTKLACAIMSADDITNLQEKGGLSINAVNITLTAVKLIKHEVLWTGTTDAGNWGGYQEINASKLTDLKVGNIINVRVSNIGTEGSINLYCGWEDADALADGVYYFQDGDEAPMEVEFPVTYKMEQQLRGKNLLVRGKNYTMTDIYIKEGTPTNTVAGYLNVTEAGMATYVLPFNVPALPDGVEAYNLTNNGDATIWAEEVSSLTADKPVLIVAAEGEYEFVSEEGASDDISGKTGTYTNGALVGTYTSINPLAQQTGSAYNYILSNGAEGVGFYQVRDNTCSVAPYRAYLSCGYNPGTTPSSAPKMRIVFRENTTTGVENTEAAKFGGASKFLRNGQLIILRNGVEYNANGALVK
jgi:hypothetical protein